MGFKISENDLYSKVTVLQNFEDIVMETFIEIHSFDDAKSLQNSIVPLLCFLVTF